VASAAAALIVFTLMFSGNIKTCGVPLPLRAAGMHA
jgi:hypothetical protein